MKIDIDECFRVFLPETIARFAYLHPEVQVEAAEDHVVLISANPCTEAATEFRYLLYRQKVFAETLELRRSLIDGVLA